MKPAAYAIRDMHDHFKYPAWDILAWIDGRVFYSEGIYHSLDEAASITLALRNGTLGQDWDWSENELGSEFLDTYKPHWLPVSSTIKDSK